jgi:hypothetical protein
MKPREPRPHDPLARSKNGRPVAKPGPWQAKADAWARRMLGDETATYASAPTQVQELVYHELQKIHPEFARGEYDRAMEATEPVMAVPESDRPLADLDHILAQPEVRRFWREWTGPMPAGGGRTPKYAGVKAVLFLMAAGGSFAHVRDALDALHDNEQLLARFEKLEGEPIELPVGSNVTRLARKLAGSGRVAARAANVRGIVALEEMFGLTEHRYVIDGTPVPAWCRQVGAGKKNPAREAELRKRTPRAGFRVYEHTSDGKVGVNGAITTPRLVRIKAWRGYFWITLHHQQLNCPVISTLIPADHDEVKAIVPLLSDLHRLHPSANIECIAGDGAFDEDHLHRLCEVNYGIHLIARHKPGTQGLLLEKGRVVELGPTGKLRCPHMTKSQWMEFAAAEVPPRAPRGKDPLRPGQPAPEGGFRIRATGCPLPEDDPDHCGKVGLRMNASWRRLTYYPKYPGPVSSERFYKRVAMIDRLNQVESAHHRLKARNLATAGASRIRIVEMDVIECILQIAQLSMTALALADQRKRRDIDPGALPEVPAGADVPAPEEELDLAA